MIDASRPCSRPTSVVEMLLSSRSAIVRMLTLLMQRSVSAGGEDVLERVARRPVHVVAELQCVPGRVVGHATVREQRRSPALAQHAGLGGGGGARADGLLGHMRTGPGGAHQL